MHLDNIKVCEKTYKNTPNWKLAFEKVSLQCSNLVLLHIAGLPAKVSPLDLKNHCCYHGIINNCIFTWSPILGTQQEIELHFTYSHCNLLGARLLKIFELIYRCDLEGSKCHETVIYILYNSDLYDNHFNCRLKLTSALPYTIFTQYYLRRHC